MDSVKSDPDKFRRFADKTGRSLIHSSMNDVQIIHDILPWIEDEDPVILRLKLISLLRGTPSHQEVLDNSYSRYTQFELLLLASLKKSALKAKLCEPNPDILVEISGRTYYIQCKRIFSPTVKGVKNNIRAAADQLKLDLADKPLGHYGIIALSIEPMVASGGKHLITQSEDSASSAMEGVLRQFIESCRHVWQNSRNVKDKRVLSVFVYMTIPTITLDETMQSVGSQLTINNISVPTSDEFMLMWEDFKIMQKYINS